MNRKNLVIIILAVLTVASLGSTGYLYRQFAALKQNPQKIVQDEAKALIAKVGELIVLPSGEDPTIATVNDPEKLKAQPFFANAQKGDKVLIYTNAKKAILYRPATHKIIDVAPVNIGAPAPTAGTPAPEPTTKPQR